MYQNGDGGDITIQGTIEETPADHLVLKHGFIQANTAAENAKGGDIRLDVNAILADKSGEGLSIDAMERLVFEDNPHLNVIQAAAPEGTQGEIHLKEGSFLDISGSIADISTRIKDPIPVYTDSCEIVDTSKASSLIQSETSSDTLWPETASTIWFNPDRFDRLEQSGSAL